MFKLVLILIAVISLSSCTGHWKSDNKNYDISQSLEWNSKGHEFFKLSQDQEALKAFEESIKFYPNYPRVWYNKGLSLSKLGRDKEAVKAYNRAIKLSYSARETRVRSLISKCNSLMILNHLRGALRSCDKAIKLNPKSVLANYNKGVVLYRLNKIKESLLLHKNVVLLDPQYINSWIYISQIYVEYKNDELAFDSYRKVIELDPKNSDAWFFQLIYLCGLEKYNDAIVSADNYVKLMPDSFDGWYLRGLIYNELQMRVPARESFEKAYQLNQEDEDLLFYLADYFLEAKEYEKAWKLANDILLKDSENIMALTIKSTVHFRKLEFDESYEYLYKIEEIKKSKELN